MFELPNFQAYHIYQQIRKGAFSHSQRQRELTEDGSLKEFPKTKAKGIDDLQIFSFFKSNLQPGTLKQELTARHAAFLVNLMTDHSSTKVSYEQFLDFTLPKTKKKITQKLVNKIT